MIVFPIELRAEQWAAQTPYAGGVAPVQWGSTAAEAKANAHKACIESGFIDCANGAATALVGNANVFITTCCNLVGGDKCWTTSLASDGNLGRTEAFNEALKVFAAAGFDNSKCSIKSVNSIRTGEKLRD